MAMTNTIQRRNSPFADFVNDMKDIIVKAEMMQDDSIMVIDDRKILVLNPSAIEERCRNIGPYPFLYFKISYQKADTIRAELIMQWAYMSGFEILQYFAGYGKGYVFYRDNDKWLIMKDYDISVQY